MTVTTLPTLKRQPMQFGVYDADDMVQMYFEYTDVREIDIAEPERTEFGMLETTVTGIASWSWDEGGHYEVEKVFRTRHPIAMRDVQLDRRPWDMGRMIRHDEEGQS